MKKYIVFCITGFLALTACQKEKFTSDATTSGKTGKDIVAKASCKEVITATKYNTWNWWSPKGINLKFQMVYNKPSSGYTGSIGYYQLVSIGVPSKVTWSKVSMIFSSATYKPPCAIPTYMVENRVKELAYNQKYTLIPNNSTTKNGLNKFYMSVQFKIEHNLGVETTPLFELKM